MTLLLVEPSLCESMTDVRFQADAAKDAELEKSIRNHGIRESLTGRRHPDDEDVIQIVNGRRRLRIAKKLGLDEVPVDVREMSDEEAYFLALELNIHSKEMSSSEVAMWIWNIRLKFQLKQKEIAERMGKSESWVSRQLKLAEMIVKGEDQDEIVPETEYQARYLDNMDADQKQQVLEMAEENGALPSGREMERMATREKTPEEVLKENPYADLEFLVYCLQHQAGLTIEDARDKAIQFQRKEMPWQKKTKEFDTSYKPDTSRQEKMWDKLRKWYPAELLDMIGDIYPAKSVPTWQNNCQTFIRTLLYKTPNELKQTVLEEFRH